MSNKNRSKSKPLTKKVFEHLLRKAAQPVSESKHGQEGTGKGAARRSDDYSGKCKSQGKTKVKRANRVMDAINTTLDYAPE